MKKLIFISLTFITTSAFAQNNPLKTPENPPIVGSVTRKQESMTGAEWQKIYKAMKIAPGVYDEAGKRIDSVEAVKLTKTFEYGIGLTSQPDGTYRRIFSKINLVRQAQMDADAKSRIAPKNPELQEGAMLDLTPFGGRMPESKVFQKALVLIFWYPGCFGHADGFGDSNEVIAKYIDTKKFEVYAVTKYSYDQATNALNISPIQNAHHLFDSPELMSHYSPSYNTIIVTDKEHRITYSAVGNAGMTPRTLNKLLKAL